MTPYQQHYAIYIGICFLIFYFFYSYHRPNLSSTRMIMDLMVGFIAAIATFITREYMNKKEILPKDIEPFVFILIFAIWILIFRSLKRMI